MAKATQKREAPVDAETSPAKQTKVEDQTSAAAQANLRFQTYIAMHPEAVNGAGSGSAAPQVTPSTPVTNGETNASIAAGIRQLMSQWQAGGKVVRYTEATLNTMKTMSTQVTAWMSSDDHSDCLLYTSPSPRDP